MALNRKNAEVEQLATEVARLRVRPAAVCKKERLEALLRDTIWPEIPDEVRGKRLAKEEEEEILGYGPEAIIVENWEELR